MTKLPQFLSSFAFLVFLLPACIDGSNDRSSIVGNNDETPATETPSVEEPLDECAIAKDFSADRQRLANELGVSLGNASFTAYNSQTNTLYLIDKPTGTIYSLDMDTETYSLVTVVEGVAPKFLMVDSSTNVLYWVQGYHPTLLAYLEIEQSNDALYSLDLDSPDDGVVSHGEFFRQEQFSTRKIGQKLHNIYLIQSTGEFRIEATADSGVSQYDNFGVGNYELQNGELVLKDSVIKDGRFSRSAYRYMTESELFVTSEGIVDTSGAVLVAPIDEIPADIALQDDNHLRSPRGTYEREFFYSPVDNHYYNFYLKSEIVSDDPGDAGTLEETLVPRFYRFDEESNLEQINACKSPLKQIYPGFVSQSEPGWANQSKLSYHEGLHMFVAGDGNTYDAANDIIIKLF